jgi:hypothetical protein
LRGFLILKLRRALISPFILNGIILHESSFPLYLPGPGLL